MFIGAAKEIWYMPQRAIKAQVATWETILYPSKKGLRVRIEKGSGSQAYK